METAGIIGIIGDEKNKRHPQTVQSPRRRMKVQIVEAIPRRTRFEV